MAPGAWKKMRQRGGKPGDLWQRFGWFRKEQTAALDRLHAGGDVFWIHAVSVGEVGIAAKLVRELLRQRPGMRFVLTTTTPTGFGLLEKLAAEVGETHVLPLYSALDGWFTVRRFLDAIRPEQIILVEAEVWPNLVFAATRRGIPVSLVNARLSPRSERRFRRLRRLVEPVYAMLARVGAQEPEDVARFAVTFGLTPQKLSCTGSIKFDMAGDVEPTAQIAQFRELLAVLGWGAADPVLIVASTHAGEEIELTRIFAKLQPIVPHLRLILVPRHVERTAEIEAELARESFRSVRRSGLNAGAPVAAEAGASILLVDTTGELRAWQHLATVVVIGKSFLATGGQNPAEAAMAAKPVVFGPHMENFEALVRILLAKSGAVQVKDLPGLEGALSKLLNDEGEARHVALAGQEALKAHEGSTRRTAAWLLE